MSVAVNSNPHFSCSISASRNFHQYRDGATSNPSWTDFQGQSCSFKLKLIKDTGYIYGIKKIELMIGGNVFAQIEFSGDASAGGWTTNKLDFGEVSYTTWANFVSIGMWQDYETVTEVTIPMDSVSGTQLRSHNSAGVDFRYYSKTTGQTVRRQTSSGYKTITATITFDKTRPGTGGDTGPHLLGTFTETVNVGSIYFYGFSAGSVSVDTTNATKTFYANSTFSSSGLVVNIDYYYNSNAGGAYAFRTPTSSYSITAPSMSPSSSNNGVATRSVGVSSSGWSTSYNVTIYSVGSFTKPTLKSIRNTDYFRKGEAGTVSNTTMTYGDNSTSSVAPTYSFDSSVIGERTVSYSATAPKTSEVKTWTSKVNVSPLSFLSLGEPDDISFDYDDEFSYSGLVVTAHYGRNDEAGTEVVNPTNVSTLPLTVGSHAITVTYRNGQGEEVSTAYTAYRNGILEFDVEIPEEKLTIAKGNVFTKTDCTPKVKRFANGVSDKNFSTFNGTWGIQGSVDTSTAGEKDVIFYATENGQTITVTKKIMVYGHERLELSGISSPIQVYVENSTSVAKLNDTNIPALANLVVKAVTNDNQKITLTRGAVNDGYRLEPALNSNLTLGENTITVIDTSDESIRATFVVNVAINQIDFSGAFTMTGTIEPYAEVGIPIDVQNVHVYATMLDGTTKEVQFSAIIEDKEGLVFFSDDDIGESYDIEFYVAKGTENETLVGTLSTILNGISSISNVTATKLTYEVGEYFDPNTVRYRINYVNGDIQYSQQGSVTDYRSTAFEYSEAGTNSAVGTVNLSFKIKGFSVTLSVSVKKLISLEFVVPNNTSLVYQIGDELDLEEKNIGIKKVYNNNDKVDVTEDDPIEWVFTDGTNDIDTCTKKRLIPEATRMTAMVKAYAYMDIYGGNYQIASSALVLTVKAIRTVSLLDEDLETITQIIVNDKDILEDHLVGKYLLVKLNDGNNLTAQEITSSYEGCSLDLKAPIVSHNPVSGTCAYTYGSDTQYASFTIHNHYLDSIDSNIDEVLESNYYVGDELDLDELEVTKTIVSTDEDDETYPEETEIEFGEEGYNLAVNGQNIDNTGYVFSNVGTYVLTITYGGKTITRNITVTAVVLTTIEPVLDASFKSFANYYDDQYLTLTGLSVNLIYNNGYVKNIPYALVDIVDENGDPFSKTQQLVSSTHNGVKLYVSYNENGSTLSPVIIPSNSGTLVVTAKALTSIEVVNNPSKMSYTYGDVFSLNGLMVKANFNNGNSESIPLTDLSISGATIGHVYNPTDDQTFGTFAVTLSYTYGGVTKTTSTFLNSGTFSLVKPKISYLMTNASTDAVRKNYQDGDTFTTDGLIVTAVMTNGWTCTVSTFSTNASTVLGLDGSGKINLTGDYGYKEITISATNPHDSNDAATVKFVVDVETSGAIVSAILMLDADSDYKNYFVGDKYNAKGVSWRVTDIDGNVFTSGVFTTSIQIGSIFRSAQRIVVQVTYSNGSFSKTESYEIIVSVAQIVSLTETKKYKLAIGKLNGDLFTEITHEEATIKLGKQYDDSGELVGEYYPLFNEDLIGVDDTVAHSNTYGFNVYKGADAENDCIGYIDMGLSTQDGTVVRKAHVILWEDPLNPIDGDGNIEVKFPHYVSGYADRINKCRFGVVYNNRLFVSGNPDFKNCDWHSGDVNFSQVDEYNNKAIKDYTYFSDLDYCYYGDSDTAIVGYDIYRDGDLIVVKEGSKHQATLYRRSMKLISATSADGNSVSEDGSLAEPSFPMFDINSNGGVGGLSHRAIVNFVGETIVLTKNGLKAITTKDDVYNTAKYTFDVSSFINERIKDENLSSAFLYIFKETLLLKTNRGLYIGYYGLRNDDNEYEWYFLSNINASIFFECDEELYFANDNGEIYRFPLTKKDYKDKTRTFVGVGGATLYINSVNDTLVASATYKDEIKNGRPFHLLTSYTVGGEDRKTQIYANLGSFVNKYHKQNTIINGGSFNQTAYVGLMNTDDNTIELKCFKANGDEDTEKLLSIQDLFYEGREVYLDHFVGDVYTLFTYRRYFLKKYNENSNNIYQLVDNYGNVMSLQGINSVRMSFLVNDLAITHIAEVSDYDTSGAKQFALLGDHDKRLDLIYYNDEVGSYSGVITKEENVNAFFVTAPYAMGSITLTKTIWQWVIANDTNLASLMDIGYLSSRKQGDYEMVLKSTQGTRQLNFSGLNFDKIQFTSDKLPHVYSKNRTVPNVNFIRFLFKNDEDSNMVLTTLNIVYTIAQFTKGVK